VHENAIAEVLRAVHFCMDVKVGLLVKELNHNWKPRKYGSYGECCV